MQHLSLENHVLDAPLSHHPHTKVQILNRHLLELADRVPAFLPGQENPIPYVSVVDPKNINPYRVNYNNIVELDVTVLAVVQSPPITFLKRKVLVQQKSVLVQKKGDEEKLQQQRQLATAPSTTTSTLSRQRPNFGLTGEHTAPSPPLDSTPWRTKKKDLHKTRKGVGRGGEGFPLTTIIRVQSAGARGGPGVREAGTWGERKDEEERRFGRDGDEKIRRDFRCLQSCLAEAVAWSPHFVDDIKRLRSARKMKGLNMTWGLEEPPQRDPSLRAPRGTGNIRKSNAAAALALPLQTSRADCADVSAILDGITETADRKNIIGGRRANLAAKVGIFGANDKGHSLPLSLQDFPPPPPPSSPGQCLAPLPPPQKTPTPYQQQEYLNRLRRLVRDTMLSTSCRGRMKERGGGGSDDWDSDSRAPQWSQKHEACLTDMRRHLRETRSPLLRAKDPGVLIGALLRRQGRIISLLDDAVLSLGDTAEALDALVSVACCLRNAGVSADGLFTRAGIAKAGASVGPVTAPRSISNGSKGKNGSRGGRNGGEGRGGAAAAVPKEERRCTIKRIHVEIHRVLGEVASFKEFKIALSACVCGGGDDVGVRCSQGNRSCSGAGIERVTVDQLDHALRTCHITRRALDPQGASHPPLTGKMASRFLESMKISNGSDGTTAGKSPNAAPALSESTTHGGVSQRNYGSRGVEGHRAVVARKRARKWTDGERDLAEQEMAMVIVERQQKFVEGYVRERRRYLKRRVEAQREGHGGFHRAGTKSSAGGVSRGSGQQCKAAEASKAEFKEAVARTKVVLKLLEEKATAAATGTVPPSNDGGGRRAGGIVTNQSNCSKSAVYSNAKLQGAALGRTKACGVAKPSAAKLQKARAGAKRKMSMVLRASTEAYSDRVGEQGGGAPRRGNGSKNRPFLSSVQRGEVEHESLAMARIGGERRSKSAAALVVQVAYRQRMFHRFVWAQAYLRGPTHVFGFFKLASLPVLRGASASLTSPTIDNAPVGGFYSRQPQPGACGIQSSTGSSGVLEAKIPTGIGSTTLQGKETAPTGSNIVGEPLVNSIDTWPEPCGFSPSALHHIHAADAAFHEFKKWSREISATTAPGTIQNIDEAILVAATVARGATPATNTDGGVAAPSSPPANPAIQQAIYPLLAQSLPPQPKGTQLFEQKHAIRPAAVRSMLVDIRVPFMPGGLEVAMEDLERTIAQGGMGKTGVTRSVDRTTGVSSSAVIGGGGVKRKACKSRTGCLGHHGGSVSFVTWYDWWLRHLPFDPASTSCLLKTVRCAKNFHTAEIAAAKALRSAQTTAGAGTI